MPIFIISVNSLPGYHRIRRSMGWAGPCKSRFARPGPALRHMSADAVRGDADNVSRPGRTSVPTTGRTGVSEVR